MSWWAWNDRKYWADYEAEWEATPDYDDLMRMEMCDEITTDEVDDAVWLEEGDKPISNV